MNDSRPELADEAWAMRLQEIGQQFVYPPTPEIAQAVRRRLDRRHRWGPRLVRAGIAAALVALITTLAVPDLRAAAFDLLGIGAVRLVRDVPPPAGIVETGFDPAYETTLDEARRQVDFTVRLLPDLGEPDRVYLYPQDQVVLVWQDVPAPGDLLSLHEIGAEGVNFKYYADREQMTTVNGGPAIWLVSPHVISIPRPQTGPLERYVEGNVLAWEADGLTFRIETRLALDDARALAESLR